MRLGADHIEADLVPTADGCSWPGTRTSCPARPTWPAGRSSPTRRATRTVDGAAVTGWFAEDFTLAELRTLRAVERLPDLREENTLYDGRFAVPTLAEVLELRESLSRDTGREIGIHLELKHPSYFAGIGLRARGHRC